MSGLLEKYYRHGVSTTQVMNQHPAQSIDLKDVSPVPIVPLDALGAEEIATISHEGDLKEMSTMDEFFGDFKKLATHPMEGSMLAILRKPNVGKREMGTYFTDVYLKRLAPMIIDPEVELHTYILYSLVVPHAKAVELSEVVSQAAADRKVDVWTVLSDATGHKMTNRGDVVSLIRVVLRRYPKVLDFLLPKNTKAM